MLVRVTIASTHGADSPHHNKAPEVSCYIVLEHHLGRNISETMNGLSGPSLINAGQS
jgi:hypothetical protein